MTGPTSARLEIRSIRMSVRLGCLPGEQDEPQAVEFDLVVRFGRVPAAVSSDRLEDTIDYGQLVERILETVDGRGFDLIEHLAGEVFDRLRGELDPSDVLTVSVRKVAPPVPEITGGAVFTLEG